MEGAFYHKEKWYLLAIPTLIAVLNHFFGLGIDPVVIIAVMLPFLALIFGDAWVAKSMIALRIAELEAQTQLRMHHEIQGMLEESESDCWINSEGGQ